MPLDKRITLKEEQTAQFDRDTTTARGNMKAPATPRPRNTEARDLDNVKNREPITEPRAPRTDWGPSAQDASQWYQGDEPTAAEIAARISDIYGRNQERGTRLWQQFTQLTMDKNSRYYQPYATPTNSAMINGLAALGVDVSGGITQEWLQTNLANYRGALDGITSDTTGSRT